MDLKTYWQTAKNNPLTSFFAVFHQLRKVMPFDYWLNTGYYLFPDFVTILITEKCNFSCKRCCSSSPIITKNPPRELTTREIKDLLDQLAVFKPAVYFCGGEPTLRQDLFEILRYAKQKKLVTAFTTNGSLFNDRMVKSLFVAKTDFISFSLDGPPSYHDKVRGFSGAYERVTKNIEKILKFRNQNHISYPHVRISAIIDVTNINNSYHVLKEAKRLGVDEICFGMLMYYTTSSENKQKEYLQKGGVGGDHSIGLEIKDSYRFRFDLKKVKDFYHHLEQEKDINIVLLAPEEKYLSKYFNPQIYPSNTSKCTTPWFTGIVKSNGDVSVCQGLVGGNIREEKFLKIWNCEKFKQFRRFRKKHTNPACFRCNEGQKIKFNLIR